MLQAMESRTLIGGIFITFTSAVTVIWYIFVLIAEWISIVDAESFILLTSQSICDICSLIQYVLFGIEILIGNQLFHLSPRWSSFSHSTFEMIALPHYLIIGLSRATGVILPARMSTFWSKRINITLVLFIWITTSVVNLIIHLLSNDKDSDFLVPLTLEYRYGPYNAYTTTHHALFFFSQSMTFLFMSTSIIVYMAAIIYCFKNLRAFERTSIQSARSKELNVEARLTIICVGNFLPAAILFVFSLLSAHLPNFEYLILIVISIIDNGINSILLPIFSGLVKKNLRRLLCFWQNFKCKHPITCIEKK